jgi:hypothetical protein
MFIQTGRLLMYLLLPYESPVAVILYMMLLLIVVLGSRQFIQIRYVLKEGETLRFRSVVPLGWAAVGLGFIGMFIQYSAAFAAIEMAGDISPAIVAAAMRPAFSYPILGFACLAISYVFRFVNQGEKVFTKW